MIYIHKYLFICTYKYINSHIFIMEVFQTLFKGGFNDPAGLLLNYNNFYSTQLSVAFTYNEKAFPY